MPDVCGRSGGPRDGRSERRWRRRRCEVRDGGGARGWPSTSADNDGGVSIGEEPTDERRRRRRAGDPRLTDADRELLRRLTDGDLKDAFQAELDAISAADPLLGGGPDDD
jgi:hypothetical protein